MEEKWTFYAAFEDRFRGSFQEIKERVADYLPYVTRQSGDITSLPALDLGSGRGEWLTLLGEIGVSALGVDQNPVAVERAQALGLNVEVGDIFDSLSAAREASHRVVTAFHVVEHLPWELQVKLFMESRRVLAPQGMLIVEWPNIENLMVASQHFWTDPTHSRPLTIPLAAFMAEYAGFENVEVRRFRKPVFDSPPIPKKKKGLKHSLSKLLTSLVDTDRPVTPPEFRAVSQCMTAGYDVALICTRH